MSVTMVDVAKEAGVDKEMCIRDRRGIGFQAGS